jgi:hypothetical protein
MMYTNEVIWGERGDREREQTDYALIAANVHKVINQKIRRSNNNSSQIDL